MNIKSPLYLISWHTTFNALILIRYLLQIPITHFDAPQMARMQLGSRKLPGDLKVVLTRMKELILLLSEIQAPPACQIILIPEYTVCPGALIKFPCQLGMPCHQVRCPYVSQQGTIGDWKLPNIVVYDSQWMNG
jgi:hypothetical protein